MLFSAIQSCQTAQSEIREVVLRDCDPQHENLLNFFIFYAVRLTQRENLLLCRFRYTPCL